MSKYTVKKLSKLASVSIRTLHHYDEIDLLKPESRAESGYRYYGQKELLRLQQILFYRELDYPLKEIKRILDDPEFDLLKSLEFHKQELQKRTSRLSGLLITIDKTIVKLKNQEIMNDEEMYEGFTKSAVDKMRKEAINTWGEQEVKAAEQKVKAMGKDKWQEVQDEGDAICVRLTALFGNPVHGLAVQKEIANHYEHLCTFYDVSEERYRGLGEMYVNDERFKAHYEKFGIGLASFLNSGIQVFCNNGLVVTE
jgi:DNA-binding transcriptional MerR regulator